MIENTRLPHDLNSNISPERKDFALIAGRANARNKSLALIIFGAIWTAFTSIFVIAFLGPLFVGKEVHFGSIVAPALIIGLFVFIGIGMLLGGIYSMYKKGGYFVGTPTRLVHYYKGTIRSIDWEQFSGDIEVSGNKQKGSISLQMRTGRMVSKKNGPDRYVPDVIYLVQIPYAFEVEKICRRRIKENDPTPANTGKYTG